MIATTPRLDSSTEEIEGLVERVTYFNEESGYAVLRVKIRGQRDPVTVLGSVTSISAGEWLTGKGWWVRDKEHGLLFKAQGLKATPPTTSEGVGIPKDSQNRARAGIDHVLLGATSQRHCALPLEKLKAAAEKLLEVPAETVERALAQMLTGGSLVLEEIDGEPLVFLPHLREAEDGIAARIRRLAAAPAPYPAIDFEKAVAWCEARTGKTLAPSQQEALKAVLSSRSAVITGGPGVRCLLCAPTGRAAKRLTETTGLEAKTIHRLLEIDPATGRFTRNDDNPLECDLLIVDETSMVDVLLMYALLRALPKNAALILVGDVGQLPSVGPGMPCAT